MQHGGALAGMLRMGDGRLAVGQLCHTVVMSSDEDFSS
jgi:hypothetical protein